MNEQLKMAHARLLLQASGFIATANRDLEMGGWQCDWSALIQSTLREAESIESEMQTPNDRAEMETERLRGHILDIQALPRDDSSPEVYWFASKRICTAALKGRVSNFGHLREALEFYADPEIYAPHPLGPAFDDHDLSFKAKYALSQLGA